MASPSRQAGSAADNRERTRPCGKGRESGPITRQESVLEEALELGAQPQYGLGVDLADP